jgi:hypothetical protein
MLVGVWRFSHSDPACPARIDHRVIAADVSEAFTKASHVGLGSDVENFVRSKTSQQVLPHLAQRRTGVILV